MSDERFRKPPPPRDADPLDGLLIVDKPAGPTSHDIVDQVRRQFGIRKVGHGGTLDPLATGLLVLLLGRATKLSSRFLGSDKTYEGTIHLGVCTDSHDANGAVTREADCSTITREQLQQTMHNMIGDQMQTPPMVSAVKLDGIPLYKRARQGETVERQARLIHLYEFSLLSFDPPSGDFVVRCTKGTYVRQLCADIGETLGCGAHLSRLRRTHSGDLDLNRSIPMEDLVKLDRAELTPHVIPLHTIAGTPSAMHG
ncbi:MAG: tRNA pseudouridine(55) synthase TruB [Verrucomicrobia bacterium]|nr:tRNA pseudouridine(55) synthase TruB [Verrucomicrobiota bacterium]